MPFLDWIGKKSVLHHDKKVPFHLLRADESLSLGSSCSDNLLIEGDNLIGLKVLLPYYAGKVKCVYTYLMTRYAFYGYGLLHQSIEKFTSRLGCPPTESECIFVLVVIEM